MGTCASTTHQGVVIPLAITTGHSSSSFTRTSFLKESSQVDGRLLQRSWPMLVKYGELDDLYEFGIEIYDEIFAAAPEICRFFPAIKNAITLAGGNMEKINLRDIAQFRNQALRLVNVFTLCVRNAYNLEDLTEQLRDIGQRHRVYVRENLEESHFRLIQDCSMLAIRRRLKAYEKPSKGESENNIENMLDTWNNVLDFIIYEIMSGYNRQIR